MAWPARAETLHDGVRDGAGGLAEGGSAESYESARSLREVSPSVRAIRTKILDRQLLNMTDYKSRDNFS
ncbi:Hypothetical protein NTJ_06921 [Nesidiocoris tenuis]|uniref:Uncharacterized protein n=1 Tax=Nesidiocoris tenuis TaxID=355587 RepID=A0ABN7ARY3_9HEMI|nr:Hypothetical protein NTJ_06921 [Nesidiocoris tenuis]